MSIEAFAHSGQIEDVARRLKDILSPADVKGLATLLEGATTERQSGMESNHERWVLETLNFLTAMDIPFYRRDERGNRLKNDYEIPERLALLREKIALCERQEKDALQREALAKDKLRMTERQLEGYRSLVGQFVEDVVKVTPGLRERLAPTPPAVATPPGAPLPDPSRS